eukprot:Em0004g1642a
MALSIRGEESLPQDVRTGKMDLSDRSSQNNHLTPAVGNMVLNNRKYCLCHSRRVSCAATIPVRCSYQLPETLQEPTLVNEPTDVVAIINVRVVGLVA